MFFYEGHIKPKGDEYYCEIVKVEHDGDDIVINSKWFNNFIDANIWIDDEISRLTIGKGVWE